MVERAACDENVSKPTGLEREYDSIDDCFQPGRQFPSSLRRDRFGAIFSIRQARRHPSAAGLFFQGRQIRAARQLPGGAVA